MVKIKGTTDVRYLQGKMPIQNSDDVCMSILWSCLIIGRESEQTVENRLKQKKGPNKQVIVWNQLSYK